MASNGRLSIFARSSPPRANGGVSRFGGPVPWLCAAAALGSAAALHALPLPVFALFALTGLCLLLAPRTPLALLTILLTLSPLRSLIATEAGIDLPLDIGQILLALYLGAWLAGRIIQRRPLSLRPEPALVTALATCGVFSIGAWSGGHIGGWLSEWLKWVIMAVMIWHLSLSARHNWRWLVMALLVSAAGNAIVGLYIFFGGSGADHLLILGRYFRAFGTFGQPNPFGGFMGIALPLALMVGSALFNRIALDWRARRPVSPAMMLALGGSALAAGLIAAALVASWSRGAWLGFAVSLFVMLIALPRRLIHGLACAGLLVAIARGDLVVGPGAAIGRQPPLDGGHRPLHDKRRPRDTVYAGELRRGRAAGALAGGGRHGAGPSRFRRRAGRLCPGVRRVSLDQLGRSRWATLTICI